MLLAAPLVLVSPGSARAAPRRWTVKGERVERLDGLDTAMRLFVERYAIRSGSLAVARAGTTLFERAYTWAETDYPVAQPASPFRLASVSKTFTAALIHELAAARVLDLDMPVFPWLGLDRPALPGQRVDPGLSTITARHLLDHSGGFDQQSSRFDPVFRMRDVAVRLRLHAAPTKHDLARFMTGEPLQFAPGARSHYSNFGYLMLGLAAEKAAGTSYLTALRARVTAPLAIDEVFVAGSRKDQRQSGEGFYEQPGSGLTPEFPDRKVFAPLPYGGGGFLTASMDAAGGLTASAGAVARLIGRYAVWGVGRRRNGQTLARSGVMSGTTSFAISRADGLDFCLVVNTRSLALDATTLEITRVLDAARLS